MSSTCLPSRPAQARARRAATYMSSPSETCETRRSRMPVREAIHSSEVAMSVAMSSLVSTAGRMHLPQPVMAAPLDTLIGMGRRIHPNGQAGRRALQCAPMTDHDFSRWRPHPWHGLDLGADAPRIVNAYIE